MVCGQGEGGLWSEMVPSRLPTAMSAARKASPTTWYGPVKSLCASAICAGQRPGLMSPVNSSVIVGGSGVSLGTGMSVGAAVAVSACVADGGGVEVEACVAVGVGVVGKVRVSVGCCVGSGSG